MALAPADAAALYKSGLSACEVAERYKLKPAGAARIIVKGGVQGLQWCRIHGKLEELKHE